MKMHELVSFFQLEYPELVQQMKLASHHLTVGEKSRLEMLKDGKSVYRGGTSQYPAELNPYHIESDIFTHTMLVCKQAENAPYEVQIAALLHDIGKPSTRAVNPKNGRVSFYNHDAVSAFMSLEILKREELGLSKDQQVHIFHLIALHTQVYKLTPYQLGAIEDDSIVLDLIRLGTADHQGRFHTAGDAVIPTMLEVWDAYEYSKVRKTTKEVIILCGLPGSGKSSWANTRHTRNEFVIGKNYFGYGDDKLGIIISRDYIMQQVANKGVDFYNWKTYTESWNSVDQKEVDKSLQEHYKKAKGYDKVIVDMTHMSKKSRRKSLSHFGSEYKKKCVVFLPDMPTLLLQNENRSGKIIGRDVIDKMMRSFYPPTYEEFDEIEYVI